MATVYELTVFASDDTAELFDVSTDLAHARPYLKAPTGFPEQEIDFAKGTASIGQVNVQVVDVPTSATDQDTGYLTAQLSNGGYSALNGHRAVLTEDIDGGGVTKIIDGVIRSIRLLDTFSSYEIELRDIRERERKTKAFATTTTPTIIPRGVLDGYGVQFVINGEASGYPIGPTQPLEAIYRMDGAGNGGVIVIDPLIPAVLVKLQMTAPVREALESVSELEGSPDVLVYDRWKVLWRDLAAGGAYTELTQIAHTHPDLEETASRAGQLRSGAIHVLRVNNAISGDTLPVDNQVIEFIVQYDGPLTDDWRFHLQDLTAGELLRNLYRGDYSVEDPRIRYNEAALLALATPVRLRLGKSVDNLREWAEKNIYPITHAAPTLNADGEIAPITYLLPDAADTLIDLDDANCRPSGGGWSQASDDAINIVRVTYERIYRIRDLNEAGDKVALSDQLQTREVTVEHRIQDSIDLLGEQPLEIKSELLNAIGTIDGGPYFGDFVDEQGARVAERITRMATDRFALGGQYFSLHCDRSDSDVEGLIVGSWVTVSVSWMPDYATAERNLNRLAQVIGRRNLDGAWLALTLIDAGTANAPLAGPTLGTVTADAAGVVSVPVTALGAGAEARVDYAINTLEPAAGSELWTFLGRVDSVPTTLTTPQITPDSTVWVRARSEAIGRRPSVYTAAVSVVVASIPRVLEVFIRVDDAGVPTVEWFVNSHTLGVRIAFEVHDPSDLPTFGTSIDADASDLSAALATTVFDPKMISVRITAYPGWNGSAVTGSAGAATTERIIGRSPPDGPNSIAITAAGWSVLGTIINFKLYYYFFNISLGPDTQSIKVTYDPGSGEVTYNYDTSGAERHPLKQSDGSTVFAALNNQVSITITITPYTGTNATGDAGGSVEIVTGPAQESGSGTSVEAQDQTIVSGNALKTIALFDIDNVDGEPRLILQAVKDFGDKGANFALDALDGGAQKGSISASVSLTGISNLVGVEPISIRVACGANTLTLAGAAFEGPTLTFTGDCAISFVDFGTGKIVAMGAQY